MNPELFTTECRSNTTLHYKKNKQYLHIVIVNIVVESLMLFFQVCRHLPLLHLGSCLLWEVGVCSLQLSSVQCRV